MKRFCAAIVLLMCLTTPAHAREYLTNVTSEVYQTAGSPHDLAARANRCIAQHLTPGRVDAPLIVNSDLDAGTVVARNAMEYGSLVRWQIRSTFTFEARDGRFRISQTNIERFYDAKGWGPIGKWWGSEWKKAEEVFSASAAKVAACVLAGDRKDDW